MEPAGSGRTIRPLAIQGIFPNLHSFLLKYFVSSQKEGHVKEEIEKDNLERKNNLGG